MLVRTSVIASGPTGSPPFFAVNVSGHLLSRFVAHVLTEAVIRGLVFNEFPLAALKVVGGVHGLVDHLAKLLSKRKVCEADAVDFPLR